MARIVGYLAAAAVIMYCGMIQGATAASTTASGPIVRGRSVNALKIRKQRILNGKTAAILYVSIYM